MGDLLKLVKDNRWGLTALLGGCAGLVGAGVIDPASGEGQGLSVAAVAGVLAGVALLVKKFMAGKDGAQPPAGPAS